MSTEKRVVKTYEIPKRGKQLRITVPFYITDAIKARGIPEVVVYVSGETVIIEPKI